MILNYSYTYEKKLNWELVKFREEKEKFGSNLLLEYFSVVGLRASRMMQFIFRFFVGLIKPHYLKATYLIFTSMVIF